jgi:inorganic pyrophosphatase
MVISSLRHLPVWDKKTHALHAIVETPRGCRSKYDLDKTTGAFVLKKMLPAGMSFPHNFGFVPSTLADDGDPLDVLILTEEPAFPGCLIRCRLVGIIKGKQKENGKTKRNDRLIGVAQLSHEYSDVKSVKNMQKLFLDELEHFFVAYHDLEEIRYELLGYDGPRKASKFVQQAADRFRKQ